MNGQGRWHEALSAGPDYDFQTVMAAIRARILDANAWLHTVGDSPDGIARLPSDLARKALLAYIADQETELEILRGGESGFEQ